MFALIVMLDIAQLLPMVVSLMFAFQLQLCVKLEPLNINTLMVVSIVWILALLEHGEIQNQEIVNHAIKDVLLAVEVHHQTVFVMMVGVHTEILAYILTKNI